MLSQEAPPIMKITQASFAGSSTRVDGNKAAALPEFAFIGRSNVGKSSLINALTGRGSLALTSSRPGKTRVVNHFLINGGWYLVDLPGYGYAKASQQERKAIEDVIRNYLNFSTRMALLFVLVDSRHDVTGTDLDFLRELEGSDIPFAIIFTKADKQGPVATMRQVEKCKEQISRVCTLPRCFVSSSQTGQGKEEILKHIDLILSTLKS